jgi:RNA recognition motif-containing protein
MFSHSYFVLCKFFCLFVCLFGRSMSSPRSPRSAHRFSLSPDSAPAAFTSTSSLVLKNLSFNLRQDRLLELLAKVGVTPQSVNYHYDQAGVFRGVAFMKFKRIEEASEAYDKV